MEVREGGSLEQHPTGPDPARVAASSSPLLCTHTLLLRFQRAIHELVKAWRINNNELISMPSAECLPRQRLAPEQFFSPLLLSRPLDVAGEVRWGNTSRGSCVDFGSIPPLLPRASLGPLLGERHF